MENPQCPSVDGWEKCGIEHMSGYAKLKQTDRHIKQTNGFQRGQGSGQG